MTSSSVSFAQCNRDGILEGFGMYEMRGGVGGENYLTGISKDALQHRLLSLLAEAGVLEQPLGSLLLSKKKSLVSKLKC